MLHLEELEYKYRADEIDIKDFSDLLHDSSVRLLSKASWDIYYVNPDNADSFQRFRMDSHNPELTKKVKTQVGNNWARIEADLPLDAAKVSEELVTYYVGMDGYKENFRIYKTCLIYFFSTVNYVYYEVFDSELRPLGKFIEVEVNKDRVAELEGLGRGMSLSVLRGGERLLEKLGITPAHRMKKSLFELYRKIS